MLKPNIIHFEFGALAVGRTYLKDLLGCRLTVSFRGYDLNFAGLEQEDYYREVWDRTDAIHLLSMDLWRRAQRRGCPPGKAHALIPPAVDTDFFMPPSSAKDMQIGTADRPLRILSVGRLEWKKGYEYALAAVRELTGQGIPCEYRIVGGGKYLEAIAFARHQMGLEKIVELLGPQPAGRVKQEMERADVFIHAAVSEGFCNTALEAQAMGLPVVCTDADGLPENVQDNVTGFVVQRRNPGALAEKIRILLQDHGLRSRMGVAARQRVETEFRIKNQIERFDAFYREISG